MYIYTCMFCAYIVYVNLLLYIDWLSSFFHVHVHVTQLSVQVTMVASYNLVNAKISVKGKFFESLHFVSQCFGKRAWSQSYSEKKHENCVVGKYICINVFLHVHFECNVHVHVNMMARIFIQYLGNIFLLRSLITVSIVLKSMSIHVHVHSWERTLHNIHVTNSFSILIFTNFETMSYMLLRISTDFGIFRHISPWGCGWNLDVKLVSPFQAGVHLIYCSFN